MSKRPNLIDGYHRFRADRYVEQVDSYRRLSAGQSPRTLVIACCDSRVDPATIFAAAPGELFVIRNVANLVPPCEEDGRHHGTSAALEFAVRVLGVETILVLGHGACGGIAASLANSSAGRFIDPWVALLRPAVERVREYDLPLDDEMMQRAVEQEAVRHSLDNLLAFPFVAEAVAERGLALEGAWFSIAAAELWWLDRASGRFALVPPEPATP